MAAFAALTLLYWATCAYLSVTTRRDSALLRSTSSILGTGAGLLVLAAIVGTAGHGAGGIPGLGAFLGLTVLVVGVFLLIPWLLHAIGHFAEAAQRSAAGIDRMVVREEFDLAERACREKRYQDAEILFLEGAAQDPANPDPLRRAGECRLAMGDPERGVAFLRRAMDLTARPEPKATLAFRIADLQKGVLNRPFEARRTLEEAAQSLSGTRFEGLALERRARI